MGQERRPPQLDRLLDEGIIPHAPDLAPILAEGDIGVVVFEPIRQAREAAKAAGWDGRAPVFSGWLLRTQRGGQGRIFIFAQHGTLLINFTPGHGYSIEPGSLDANRV